MIIMKIERIIIMKLFDRKFAGVSLSEKELTQICSITYLLR